MPENNGFAEAPHEFPRDLDVPESWMLKVGPDGRVVIPAAARHAMGLGEDGMVTAYMRDGELRLVSPLGALRRARALLAPYKTEESEVDSFIAERRAAAARGD